MQDVPLIGIDVILKRIRPNAYIVLSNNTITDYIDPDNLPCPTWEEIIDLFEKDVQKYS
jgi:hypothetical protein